MAESTGFTGILGVLRWFVDKIGAWGIIFGPLMGLIVMFKEYLKPALVAGLDDLHGMLVTASGYMDPATGAIAPYLGKANYIFPLTECGLMIASYLAVRCLCVTLRLIKGFIPTYG